MKQYAPNYETVDKVAENKSVSYIIPGCGSLYKSYWTEKMITVLFDNMTWGIDYAYMKPYWEELKGLNTIHSKRYDNMYDFLCAPYSICMKLKEDKDT